MSYKLPEGMKRISYGAKDVLYLAFTHNHENDGTKALTFTDRKVFQTFLIEAEKALKSTFGEEDEKKYKLQVNDNSKFPNTKIIVNLKDSQAWALKMYVEKNLSDVPAKLSDFLGIVRKNKVYSRGEQSYNIDVGSLSWNPQDGEYADILNEKVLIDLKEQISKAGVKFVDMLSEGTNLYTGANADIKTSEKGTYRIGLNMEAYSKVKAYLGIGRQ